jgi:hypothetical protein
LNAGQFMVLLQYGNMNRETSFYNAEMFARYVKPQIADLFEREWENKWWPKPLLSESQLMVPRPPAMKPWTNQERPKSPLGVAP